MYRPTMVTDEILALGLYHQYSIELFWCSTAEKFNTIFIRVALHPNWCSLVQHRLAPIKKRVHNGVVKSRGQFNHDLSMIYW